jgi:hypothetical protein
MYNSTTSLSLSLVLRMRLLHQCSIKSNGWLDPERCDVCGCAVTQKKERKRSRMQTEYQMRSFGSQDEKTPPPGEYQEGPVCLSQVKLQRETKLPSFDTHTHTTHPKPSLLEKSSSLLTL